MAERQLTPMRQQYKKIKDAHQDCLLFFRLGDFYEMFDDDALTASKELNLTLTTRDRGKPADEQTPMCGVPAHSSQTYIASLIAKGYKVAICEQTQDPTEAVGLVERDVIRIITPGTVTDESMLDADKSNYLAAIYSDLYGAAAAFCDISTGEFCVSGVFNGEKKSCDRQLQNELARFSPCEAVLSKDLEKNAYFCDFLQRRMNCMLEGDEGRFELDACKERLRHRFSEDELKSAGLSDPEEGESDAAIRAAGALLGYLDETLKFELAHINSIEQLSKRMFMDLDYSALQSLELTANLRTGDKRGSLLWALDRTKTPMGSRLLRSWVERPLLSPVAIRRRLGAVNELYGNNIRRAEIMICLSDIGDIRRVISKAVSGSATPRDLYALGSYVSRLPRLSEYLLDTEDTVLRAIKRMDTLPDISVALNITFYEDEEKGIATSVHEGYIFRDGYNKELDSLREMCSNGGQMILDLEAREREKTGIKKLKIGYNRIFGYYIEIPHAKGQAPEQTALPEEYIRKQTMANAERYFTYELKELENALLSARDDMVALEYRLFTELRAKVASQVDRIQHTADAVAELDVYCSLAETAVRNNYVCPEVDAGSTIEIIEGRHPVVEASRRDELFIPNDTLLNDKNDRVAIITGPNMAGKSTYMRQTALITIMAQIGSFVPAKRATIGVVDRVFTRIGASDDLASGQSTFMVEMNEVSAILQGATNRSLLILDEIGRGTSTFDGMAIARAVLEFCADKRRLGAKTMFATHYHELSKLEDELDGVKNYNISAKKQKDGLVFLRKIVPGAADDSYGIEVAKLAGVPDSVIARARACLEELESGQTFLSSPSEKKKPKPGPDPEPQISLASISAEEVCERIKKLSLDTITPLEALTLLYELKKKVSD